MIPTTQNLKIDSFLGLSYHVRVLVVNYTLRKDEAAIRIISARKATKKEQKAYAGEK
jgi:uncharacterized DUF497 family protein